MYRYTNISFPSLGIDIDPLRAFSIGPLSIHMYGLIIAVGLMLAVVYGMRRSKEFGLTEDHVLDGVLWITPFAILCARAYYCAFRWEELYADNPISALYIWEGGIAIYGGVLGAVAGIILYCRIRKISLGAALDLVLLGFLIGQAIGRWGNFFNREAFGAETDSFLRMGLFSPLTGTTTYYHPTFLYESVWNALGFVILHFLSKKRQYDGQIALGYAAWYGLGRTFIEGLRTDSLYIPGTPIRVSQLLAVVSCLAALAVLAYFVIKPPAKKLFVHRVAEETTEPTEGGNEDA
ncbi:MAG: prolipoprotein diacylglyceryl transferase [Oscillospiraceae bacterium]|nr:prolipoprotein diacylglyceryl transferase [Oscillospiraceae bacterium]